MIAAKTRGAARLGLAVLGSLVLHGGLAGLLAGEFARRTKAPLPLDLATLEIVARDSAPTRAAVAASDTANARAVRATRDEAAAGRPRSRSSTRRHARPNVPARVAAPATSPPGTAASADPVDGRSESLLTAGAPPSASAAPAAAADAAETGVAEAGRTITGPTGAQGLSKNSAGGPVAGREHGSGGGRSGLLVSAGVGDSFEVVVHPRPIYEIRSASLYPHMARQLGLEGTVKLSVATDESGSVTTVAVLRAAGHGFDEAAMKALRAFRFSPARTRDGRAVPFRFTYTYVFTLDD